MKHLHIYKQSKIENKGKKYNLIIYTRHKRRKETNYIVSIFGEYNIENRGPFYGKLCEKILNDGDSRLNKANALKYEDFFSRVGSLYGIRFEKCWRGLSNREFQIAYGKSCKYECKSMQDRISSIARNL